MYTRYTCIYTIYTPNTPLNTLCTPFIHTVYTQNSPLHGRYDIVHNKDLVLRLTGIAELFVCAKCLADVVMPQEYGLNADAKVVIGAKTAQPLIRKILGDLGAASETGGELANETVNEFDSRHAEELGIKSPGRQ